MERIQLLKLMNNEMNQDIVILVPQLKSPYLRLL